MKLPELDSGRNRDVFGPVGGRVIKVLRSGFEERPMAEEYVRTFDRDQKLIIKHLGDFAVSEEMCILPHESGGWKVISNQEFIRGMDLRSWNKKFGIEPDIACQLTDILDRCMKCCREAEGFVDYLGENNFDIEWRRVNEGLLFGELKDKFSSFMPDR